MLTFLLPLFCIIQTASALGGFIETCSEVRFWDPDSVWGNKYKTSPYLVARCTSSDGDDYCTWLPLTMCYSNVDGQLVARSQ
ncbi:hypothetical protein GQ607_012867 [Colletotrichum asianum]|uniref:Uncharacterized protein n=1 Tax=Colletotrichum asianum TaxID=702518 RepID=A0A8H3W3L7_9PEZI|nr:hypothetical protein GQ607_012867 [Colletotrichum asianum]